MKALVQTHIEKWNKIHILKQTQAHTYCWYMTKLPLKSNRGKEVFSLNGAKTIGYLYGKHEVRLLFHTIYRIISR